METKHTPGPWYLAKDGIHIYAMPNEHWEPLDNPEENVVGRVFSEAAILPIEFGKFDDVIKANARLIAAAPELLAALQQIDDYLDMGPNMSVDAVRWNRSEIKKRVQAAIKKATEGGNV